MFPVHSFINFNLFFAGRLFIRYASFFSFHSTDAPGLHLPNVLAQARNHTTNLMNHERSSVHVAGRSLISLIVPNQAAAVSEEHQNHAVQQLNVFREEIPDLRFIYWAAGSVNRFERFVREPARDLFTIRIDLQGIGGDSIQSVAFPVIHRIQQEPRRIINHRCVMGLFFYLLCLLLFDIQQCESHIDVFNANK